MEFAQLLRNLKDATGISNYRLAQLLHCSQSTVKSWLDGENNPTRAKLYSIADVFGLTLDQVNGDAPIDFERLGTPPVNKPTSILSDEDSQNDEIIKEIAGNPYSRALFYAMKGATPEEYKQAAELVKMIRRTGK